MLHPRKSRHGDDYMNDMQRLKLEWLKREIKITRLKIEAWFIKTPVYRFFDIYMLQHSFGLCIFSVNLEVIQREWKIT